MTNITTGISTPDISHDYKQEEAGKGSNVEKYIQEFRARGGAVGKGTALQAGGSRVRFPMDCHNPSAPHCGPGVDSASNKNEYKKYFLGVKAAGA
jgi:hypothetical protein